MTAPAIPDTDQLRLRNITLDQANEFIATVDPGHRPVRGHKFALALEDHDGGIRGVAITGDPTVPALDTGWRLEVLHLATDGTPNVRPKLYRAVARAAVAVGYRRQDILTHTIDAGAAADLRIAGWVPGIATGDRSVHGDQSIRWHAASPAVGGHARAA